MSYQNNTTHESIVRQSSLKAAVDYINGQGIKCTLTEVLGVAMAFTEYGLSGDYEIAKKVESKLASLQKL
jgi:hypothetical protein